MIMVMCNYPTNGIVTCAFVRLEILKGKILASLAHTILKVINK